MARRLYVACPLCQFGFFVHSKDVRLIRYEEDPELNRFWLLCIRCNGISTAYYRKHPDPTLGRRLESLFTPEELLAVSEQHAYPETFRFYTQQYPDEALTPRRLLDELDEEDCREYNRLIAQADSVDDLLLLM